ncbi:D-2-hydroxyacid dehydrogenase [Seongchinamella sediminis]|uniref:D-2-hydroxyacid dehydrogenase n=1 Tax=Seongchinamella sediminis TaxID=2283635 RepID=A0A3L7E1A7_9GAMM|nr:D-2-hydroxyacid dehydrogenase [Seongchinamella sediminis]RLQ23294.1 D-2-hydroxyacid dehydrogenase [Seongchinamella sediminis]
MRVLVLDKDFDQYRQLLAAAGVAADAGADPGAHAGDYDVLLAQPDLAARYLEQGGEVAWIQSTWAGIDRLLPAALGRDLVVTAVKGIFGPQMAEYVFAFLLGQSRSLAFYRAEQDALRWTPQVPRSLAGQSMVILGTGTIGNHIAGVARAFGMRSCGISRSARPAANFDRVCALDEAPDAARGARVLVNTLPATAHTRGALNAALLHALDPAATLFNVGRGEAVDEASLRGWLEARPQSMAVLDVFAREPLPADHWLWRHPQVRITPHVAALSVPADVVAIFLDNLQRRQRGQPLRYVIDLARGY